MQTAIIIGATSGIGREPDLLLVFPNSFTIFATEITALPSGDEFPKGAGSREVAGTL